MKGRGEAETFLAGAEFDALDAPLPAPGEPRTVQVGSGDLADISAQAWTAILAANAPPRLFRQGGMPTRLERGDDGTPLLRPLSEHRLRYELARAAQWMKPESRGATKIVSPPIDVVRDMLAHPDPPLPALRRITEAPIFASDGSLMLAPGYHAAAATYYAPAPGFCVPGVATQPNTAALRGAVHLLCIELLGDFPFTGDAERAHALALLLAPFLREMIDGPVPLTLIEKPAPGTGATLLVDALMRPALGRSIPTMTESRDEDDWRKKITAKLLTAPTVVFIDNLNHRLESPALAAAITSKVWEDRRLGSNDIVRPPVRCVWVATGNNPGLSNEIARRTVRVRLDAKRDRPWTGREFRHSDLLGWAAANRAELVAAALTIGQAWISEGRPHCAVGLGQFEDWARVLGGVLEVAGVRGFLTNAAELYETADAEGAAWRSFVVAWWEKHAGREVGVSELWELVAAADAELNLGTGTDRSQRTKLGNLLKRQRDRQFGGLRITAGGTRQGAQLWRLVQCA